MQTTTNTKTRYKGWRKNHRGIAQYDKTDARRLLEGRFISPYEVADFYQKKHYYAPDQLRYFWRTMPDISRLKYLLNNGYVLVPQAPQDMHMLADGRPLDRGGWIMLSNANKPSLCGKTHKQQELLFRNGGIYYLPSAEIVCYVRKLYHEIRGYSLDNYCDVMTSSVQNGSLCAVSTRHRECEFDIYPIDENSDLAIGMATAIYPAI